MMIEGREEFISYEPRFEMGGADSSVCGIYITLFIKPATTQTFTQLQFVEDRNSHHENNSSISMHPNATDPTRNRRKVSFLSAA